MNNIILIGFMGCGKTTVGKNIAQRLDIPFVDMDQEIQEKSNMTIKEIFEKHGEAYFRDLETAFLKSFNKSNHVLSTGGGIVTRAENIDIIKKLGTVVFLHASFEQLMKNLEKDNTRPLLQGDNYQEKARELLNQREGIYLGTADLIVQTTGKTVSEITDEILSFVVLN